MKTQLRFIETRHSGRTTTWDAKDWDDAWRLSAKHGETATRIEYDSKEAALKEIGWTQDDELPEEWGSIPDGVPIIEWMSSPNNIQWGPKESAPTMEDVIFDWIAHDLRALKIRQVCEPEDLIGSNFDFLSENLVWDRCAVVIDDDSRIITSVEALPIYYWEMPDERDDRPYILASELVAEKAIWDGDDA